MAEKRKQKKPKVNETQAIAIIAGALAVGASAKATATSLSASLGIPTSILLPILQIAMSRPVTFGVSFLPSASASAQSSAMEAEYRAAYVWAASQRLLAVKPGLDTYAAAWAAEKRYFNQHIEAAAKRHQSSVAVDAAAARYGDELGWYSKMDPVTSAECREANGKNFSASRIPAIGWPGSVHPHCRCKPGKKHATSQTVYSVKPDPNRKVS